MDRRPLRLFTFSPLQWPVEEQKNTGNQRGATVTYREAVALEVRSPKSDLIDVLADRLLQQRLVLLGHRMLPLIDLTSEDQLLFPSRAVIRTISPITVHLPGTEKKTDYFAPWEEEFSILLAKNLDTKLRAVGQNSFPALGCEPLGNIEEKETQFKGTSITGYQGSFLLETAPENMELLYYAGLGARNSQGFGMFRIEQMFFD